MRAGSVTCARALARVVAIEAGHAGPWVCSRSVGGTIELACVRGRARIELLERSPVAARRRGSTVTLGNWTFRLSGTAMEGHPDGGRWVSLGRAPWCIPDVPREVLVAFALKPLTRSGGCFTLRAAPRR